MTSIAYAMPILRGRPQGNPPSAQRLETFAFWTMCTSMVGITLALTVAGAWQVALQRLPEASEALGFMATQDKIAPVFWVREVLGLIFFVGLIAYLGSFFDGSKELAGDNEQQMKGEEDEKQKGWRVRPAI